MASRHSEILCHCGRVFAATDLATASALAREHRAADCLEERTRWAARAVAAVA